ncbi:hypothetical protein FACS1894105_11480 [Clostridia bacterium]|nr:hypothetical protein FACS1894105_11480 [Clostridia bacterium]
MSKFQRVSLVIAVVIILSALPVLSADDLKVGDPIGNVLNSDIKVFIDGNRIPSYVANNRIAVVAEDLANYGFNVKYDDTARVLSIYRNESKALTPIKDIADNTQIPGSVAFPYVYSDIVTTIADEKIESFSINGQTVIYLDSLGDYGTFKWDGEKRESQLILALTIVYVTKTGGSFHRAGCKYLSKSSNQLSRAEALKSYAPCSVCKP